MTETATVSQKREKRSYSKEFIADALNVLETHNGNVLGASRELGIPRLTLREWAINRRRVDTEVQAIQQEKAPELAGLFEDTARMYLDHARNPFVISASSGIEAVKSAAICTDKSQLLSGRPTMLVGNIDRQELAVTLYAALEELEELKMESRDPLDRARNITPTGPEQPQDIALFQG